MQLQRTGRPALASCRGDAAGRPGAASSQKPQHQQQRRQLQRARSTQSSTAAQPHLHRPLQPSRQVACAFGRAAAASDVENNVDSREPSAEEQAQMDRDAADIAAALASVYEGMSPDDSSMPQAAGSAYGQDDVDELQKGGKPERAGRRSRSDRPPERELPIESLPKARAGSPVRMHTAINLGDVCYRGTKHQTVLLVWF